METREWFVGGAWCATEIFCSVFGGFVGCLEWFQSGQWLGRVGFGSVVVGSAFRV